MSEDEEEIKIEYFESFDTDPLRENSKQPTCPTNNSVTSNTCEENINQLVSNSKNYKKRYKNNVYIIVY